MQSPSLLHEVLQAFASHRYGLHCVCADAGQVPVPLQEADAVAVPALHEAPRHCVDPPAYAHEVALTRHFRKGSAHA